MRDELQELWQSAPSGANSLDFARATTAKELASFDQRFRSNTVRRSGFGIWLLIVGVFDLTAGHALHGALLVGFVVIFLGRLWWHYWQRTPLDVQADAKTYRRVMLERYDRLGRRLRSFPLWFLAPFNFVVFVGTLTDDAPPLSARVLNALVCLVWSMWAWWSSHQEAGVVLAERRFIEDLYKEHE